MKNRRAFTLVELLVVIGMITMLLAILMPGVSHVREEANRAKCQANMRQILAACAIYQTENEGSLPWCNWLGSEVSGYRPQGWLYKYPRGTDAAASPDDVKTGAFYCSFNTTSIFRCPDDATTAAYIGPIRYLTSYQMNGAASGYGKHLPSFHVMKFDADAILFWEANPFGPPVWTSGSAYPSLGITTRHSKGGSIGCSDGHVEWMSQDDYNREEQNLPGRLWCSPQTKTGT